MECKQCKHWVTSYISEIDKYIPHCNVFISSNSEWLDRMCNGQYYKNNEVKMQPQYPTSNAPQKDEPKREPGKITTKEEPKGGGMLDLHFAAIRLDDIVLIEKVQRDGEFSGYGLMIYQKSVDREQKVLCESREQMEEVYKQLIEACNK